MRERRIALEWLKEIRKGRSSPLLLLVFSFLVGLVGQWEMAESDQLYTLFTGLALFASAVFLFFRALNGDPVKIPLNRELPTRQEALMASFVFLVALAFRCWDLGRVPPGLFVDQGYQGYMALQILHQGYRPFFDHELLQTPALYLYELATWFGLFGTGVLSHRIFFVLISLLALPFIYWSFRELAGPRTALLALFILSVMRWHVNLSRWGCEGIHNFIFMFSSLAFFLYALRTGKRWAAWTAGALLGIGMYYYLSYYVFPLLLYVYGGYELAVRAWEPKRRKLVVESAVFFLCLLAPLVLYAVIHGGLSGRMAEVSLLSEIINSKSFSPLWDNLLALLFMFNRQGDFNGRHNLPGAPMLDSVTAVLFVLGFLAALLSWKQRVTFYLLAGLAFLSLPGVLSIDMPNTLRLGGMTPFLALTAAFPLAVVWEKMTSLSGRIVSKAAVLLLALPLAAMAAQNAYDYFGLQMRSPEGWYWWDPVSTAIGERIHKDEDSTDFYVTPLCYKDFTVRFLSYPHEKNYLQIQPTTILPCLPGEPGKSVEYVLEPQRLGTRRLIERLFPDSRREIMKDPANIAACCFYRVPDRVLNGVRGLTGRFLPSGRNSRLERFPEDLPDGPFEADLEGYVCLPQSGMYQLSVQGNVKVSINIGGKILVPGQIFPAPCGYYSIRLGLSAKAGKSVLMLSLEKPDRSQLTLDCSCLTTLPLNRGLLATYDLSPGPASSGRPTSTAVFVWEQVLDYDYRYSYPFLSQSELDMVKPCRWTGELVADEVGEYELKVWTSKPAVLLLDGEKHKYSAEKHTVRVYLEKGSHGLEIRQPEPSNHFMLLWKPPGDKKLVPVPLEAFGTTRLL